MHTGKKRIHRFGQRKRERWSVSIAAECIKDIKWEKKKNEEKKRLKGRIMDELEFIPHLRLARTNTMQKPNHRAWFKNPDGESKNGKEKQMKLRLFKNNKKNAHSQKKRLLRWSCNRWIHPIQICAYIIVFDMHAQQRSRVWVNNKCAYGLKFAMMQFKYAWNSIRRWKKKHKYTPFKW